MDQLKKLYATLSIAQKIALGVVIILLAVGVPMFTKWQHESGFKPLFTGMAPEDAGAIIAKLKENGVEYRLAENGSTVLVPADKVDEQRIELAGAGLPKSGRIGFELFDKTNMSLTDFGEHVNYHRAIEGELEKTIRSISEIEDARVHVTFLKDSVFLDSREPAKASVLVHVREGAHLDQQNVVAIANLVASAVEGLSPDAVSVVDMRGNLLSRQKRPSMDGTDGGEGALDYKHQVERDLTNKVEATLDPLLGDGRFRVGVTVDCDFSTSDQTDEVYDPTRSVMSNSQKSEDMSQGPTRGGVPGTPSNLPRSQIRAQAGGGVNGGATVSRRTENTTFATSRTVREVKSPRGIVKKISAALLIDQDVEWQSKGKQRKRVFIPPSPEKLKAIHDVVAGVLGITNDRGDELVVETLPFEQTRNAEDTLAETAKPAPGPLALKDLMANKKLMIGAGAGLLFLVLLVGFMLRRPKAGPVAEKPMIMAGKAESHSVDGQAGAEGRSKQVEGVSERGSPGHENAVKEIEELSPFLQLPGMTNHTKALLDHLRKTINKDPETAAAVIRSWMEEV
jgi:flagellar M-ring protein FliF